MCNLYDNNLLLQVVVTLMALSPDGSMMGTAETKLPEEGLGGLVSLKFWTSGLQSKGFSLSTIIYEPHRFIPADCNLK